MEYGLKVFTTFVAFSYFCSTCNFLVMAYTHVFKYAYLKTEFEAFCLPGFNQFWTVS